MHATTFTNKQKKIVVVGEILEEFNLLIQELRIYDGLIILFDKTLIKKFKCCF